MRNYRVTYFLSGGGMGTSGDTSKDFEASDEIEAVKKAFELTKTYDFALEEIRTIKRRHDPNVYRANTSDIIIEHERYGRVEWTLPKHIADGFVASGRGEEVFAYLGQKVSEIFGVAIFCLASGELGEMRELDELLRIVIEYGKKIESSKKPQRKH